MWLVNSKRQTIAVKLRLTECLSLRVKDIDFGYRQINVRDGKGVKDRQTMLPFSLIEALQLQLQFAKKLHQKDLSEGLGEVFLPNALEKKHPNLNREWSW
jgi:integrase